MLDSLAYPRRELGEALGRPKMDRFVREANEDDGAPERATERRARLGGVADDAGGCAWREVGLGDDDSVVQPESVRDL